MSIKNNIEHYNQVFLGKNCSLVAVSKTKSKEEIMEAYEAGQRIFGENKVQEMTEKYEQLPKDIQWHLIGHLQTNKVKYMANFVDLVHSVDSYKLLYEIDKQGKKTGRVIDCLLQVYIAKEETKFGLDANELNDLIFSWEVSNLLNINIKGLMGMASFTEDKDQVRSEFKYLKGLFESLKSKELPNNVSMQELSMGMSSDYEIAVEEGSTLVRIGSAIFGERNYQE